MVHDLVLTLTGWCADTRPEGRPSSKHQGGKATRRKGHAKRSRRPVRHAHDTARDTHDAPHDHTSRPHDTSDLVTRIAWSHGHADRTGHIEDTQRRDRTCTQTHAPTSLHAGEQFAGGHGPGTIWLPCARQPQCTIDANTSRPHTSSSTRTHANSQHRARSAVVQSRPVHATRNIKGAQTHGRCLLCRLMRQ